MFRAGKDSGGAAVLGPFVLAAAADSTSKKDNDDRGPKAATSTSADASDKVEAKVEEQGDSAPESRPESRDIEDKSSAGASSAAEERENVQLQVLVSGMWRRLIGGLCDLVILAPVLALVIYLAARIAGLNFDNYVSFRPEILLELVLVHGSTFYGLLALALTVAFFYAFIFTMTIGRTPGQKLVGVRVIDIYGERPGVVRALLRSLGFAIALLPFGLGLLWIGFDREKRGLQDWIAGTYVIRRLVGPKA
jgi:uncharacterized RDD family membrane protein YckC